MGYGERSFGNSRGGGGFSDAPREMHDAVCSDCGKECKVPFKPSKDTEGKARPVYCRDCYSKHKKF